MIAIFTVIISFITAVIGLIHSHGVQQGGRSTLGLTPIGFTLLILAIFGMIFGVTKAIKDHNSAIELKAKEEKRDQMLQQIYAQVVGYKETVQDPATSKRLGEILNGIQAVASIARESDFAMSDFSRSNFKYGKFTNANFEGALFDGANLKGADLSKAVIDLDTKLPK